MKWQPLARWVILFSLTLASLYALEDAGDAWNGLKLFVTFAGWALIAYYIWRVIAAGLDALARKHTDERNNA